MIYQHQLAYLLGLEGAALMLAFNGGYDREFTEARLAEVRAMLDSPGQFGDGAGYPSGFGCGWVRHVGRAL